MSTTVEVILKANIAAYTQALGQAQQATEKLADSAVKAGESIDKSGKGDGLKQTASSAKTATSAVDATGRSAKDAGSKLEAAGKAGAKAGASSKDGATQAQSAWSKLQSTADKQSESWNKVANTMAGIGAVAAATVGLAVREYANFDQAMSGVASTGADAKASIEALRDAAITAGADTAYSATEAAQGIEELARAGVSTADILNGGLTGALDLAAAGQLSVADAAGLASTAMTQFKLSGEDTSHVADLLAAGAGKAMGGVDDLGQALSQGGLVASQFGLSIEETVGGLSAFASAGLLGSDAGTSLKAMLLALANPAGKTAQTMEELGINAYDAQGNFIGLEGLAGVLQDRLGGLDQATRNQALAQIFGNDAIRAASILYENGSDGIAEWTTAVDDAGYAAETARELQNNLKGDLEKLGGSWSTLAIQMGEKGNGPLRTAVQALTGLVDVMGEVPGLSSGLMVGAAGLAALALGAAGLMKGVTAVAEFRTAVEKLQASDPKLAKLAGSLGKVTSAVGGLMVMGTIVSMVGEFNNSLRAAAVGADEAEAAITRLAQGTGGLDAVFKRTDGSAIWEGAGVQIDSVSSAMDYMASGMPKWTGAGKAVTEQFALLDDQLVSLASTDPAQAAATFTALRDEAKATGVPVEKLIELFPSYASSIQNLAAQNGLAELSGNYLADAMEGVFPPLNEVKDAASETGTVAERMAAQQDLAAAAAEALAAENAEAAEAARDAYDAYMDQVDAIQSLNDAQTQGANTWITSAQAQDDWITALREAKEAAKDAEGGLTGNSDAAIKNRKSMTDLAQQARETTDAMLANGDGVDTVNSKMESQRSSMIKLMKSYGMTSGEAEAYADSLGLIPNYVETTVAMPGAKLTQDEANEINKLLEDVPEELRPEIIVTAQTKGADEAKRAIASIPSSKTVTINVKRNFGNSVDTITGNPSMGYKSSANGNIFDFYANGGLREQHVAQIAPAGAWRLWAEPETGGEAYIPLAPEKRTRSRDIWWETGRRLGTIAFADGGLTVDSTTRKTVSGLMNRGVLPLDELKKFRDALAKAREPIADLKEAAESAKDARSAARTAASEASAASNKANADLAAAKKIDSDSALGKARRELAKAQKVVDPSSKLGKAREATRDAEEKLAAAKGKKAREAAEKALEKAQAKQEKLEDARQRRIDRAQEKADYLQVAHDKKVAAAQREADKAERNVNKAIKERTKAEEDAEKASAKLKEKQDKAKEAADDLADAQQALADSARSASEALRQTYMVGGDAADLLDNMRTGAKESADFAKLIEQLRKAGLDEDIIQEIIDQGVEAGSETAADIIAKGPDSVAELNKAAKALADIADKLGLLTAAGQKNYADGGIEDHSALITNRLRVFGEPETGGEAYIPLALSKRARSLAIWEETGRRLGAARYMADGGILTSTASTGLLSRPSSMTVTYVTQHNNVALPEWTKSWADAASYLGGGGWDLAVRRS